MKIAVVGTGYVGLSLATLLSQNNEVVAVNVTPKKTLMINKRISPIKDDYIEYFFKTKDLNLKATLNHNEAFEKADYIIICTPTNYDEETGYFDTSTVEDTISRIKSLNLDTTVIIKSTVPVGFTEEMRKKYDMNNIIFSPEFLREGKALYDNLYPSRIIVGDSTDEAKIFAGLLVESAIKDDIVIKYMNSTEAEAVKLFANTFLAMRVAYFNELDTFAEVNGLSTKDIIEGVCLDPRIGDHYNNPSFGYGGYCLPKDTKQLLANYEGIPQNLMKAIVLSNETRKEHIADMIMQKNPSTVGIYRLTMKKDSDNFRASAIQDIMRNLGEKGLDIIIHEPTLDEAVFHGYRVVNDYDRFVEESDVIVVNRIDEKVKTLKKEIYTRDLYARD